MMTPVSLDVRYIFDWSAPAPTAEPMLRWLVAAGADEFTLDVMALVDTPAPIADAFEDALAPFALPLARRRTLQNADGPDRGREVRLWRYSAESLAALLPFFSKGLFHYDAGPAGWLEDLAVYRRRELLLGVITHERAAVLRLATEEHAAVAALGVRSESSAEWIGY
jgi:hypothetical protein